MLLVWTGSGMSTCQVRILGSPSMHGPIHRQPTAHADRGGLQQPRVLSQLCTEHARLFTVVSLEIQSRMQHKGGMSEAARI